MATPLVPKDEIKEMARRMRNLDPRLYETFMGALARHMDEVTVAVTETLPGNDVFVAQGRAQAVRGLYRWLLEI